MVNLWDIYFLYLAVLRRASRRVSIIAFGLVQYKWSFWRSCDYFDRYFPGENWSSAGYGASLAGFFGRDYSHRDGAD